MKTKTITLYQYDELPTEKAKENALNWMAKGALDFEWWDFIYEDAKQVGLKITAFDLDRNKHVEGTLELSGLESCKAIIENHGEACETYKLAVEYLPKFEAVHEMMECTCPDYCTVEDHTEVMDELEQDYLDALREEFASILQDECDYRLSREALEEDIRANEYDFDEDGNRA